MDAKLKKQIIVGVGVVIGTTIFKKFLAPSLETMLPNKGV